MGSHPITTQEVLSEMRDYYGAGLTEQRMRRTLIRVISESGHLPTNPKFSEAIFLKESRVHDRNKIYEEIRYNSTGRPWVCNPSRDMPKTNVNPYSFPFSLD